MNYQDELIYKNHQFSVPVFLIYVSDALFGILATQTLYIIKENFGMQGIYIWDTPGQHFEGFHLSDLY